MAADTERYRCLPNFITNVTARETIDQTTEAARRRDERPGPDTEGVTSMPAEPTERDRYAHLRSDEYKYLVRHAANLCEVALRPSSIDNYAAEKIGQAIYALGEAERILRHNIGAES